MDHLQELGLGPNKADTWSPGHGPGEEISAFLVQALKIIDGVPYTPSSRFVFYGLWDEPPGEGAIWFNHMQPKVDEKHSDFKLRCYKDCFLKRTSKARHTPAGVSAMLDRWEWDIMRDEGREAKNTWHGWGSFDAWLEYYIDTASCDLDPWPSQDTYILFAFEANAMVEQFEYWTAGYPVSLWPFGGDIGTDYKNDIAVHVEHADSSYGLPVVLFYFGDADPKGLEIAENNLTHIKDRCEVDFKAYRAGLTDEQANLYGKSGIVQWESLGHYQAGEIIKEVLEEYIDLSKTAELRRQAKEQTAEFKQRLQELIK
jgi:hypothetical protein